MLLAHFSAKGVPQLKQQLSDKQDKSPLLELYLPWLQEDGTLAQQVAEAWNTVVRQGEADIVKCYCELCSPEKHEKEADEPVAVED